MLTMTTNTKDHRYWFEKVCFEFETNYICSSRLLMVKRLNVVHDRHSPGWSVLIWRGQLRIWNQRFLQQLFSYGETSQCCSWPPKPLKICTDLKGSSFCSNHSLMVKRLNVVRDSQSLRSSVVIWRGLLRIWNQRFLQQPFSYCEASQCFSWQPKPMMIGTDLKRSASNLRPNGFCNNIFLITKRFKGR